MSFSTLREIVDICKNEGKPFWRIIMEENCHEQAQSEEECFATMGSMLKAMTEADRNYDGQIRSASGMAGGAGEMLAQYGQTGRSLLGDYLTEVVEKSVKMAESNACMKRIVAAPTAGSCGVIPAVLLSYKDYKAGEASATEDRLTEALFVAGGIGEVYANSASIAGAEGGCQAEIGVAASMAAGALAYLEGGGEETIVHAAALAMKSLMGLTCDPVAGLVEVPCIKRNATGAMAAVTGAHLALAGLRSAIPPDEVVDSMRRVGNLLPACLRETSQGGLATTPTGEKIARAVSKL